MLEDGFWRITQEEFPSARVFRANYLNVGRPGIFLGVVKEWLAYRKWTFEYMRDNYGKIIVPIVFEDVDFKFRSKKGVENSRDIVKPRAYGYEVQCQFSSYIDSILNCKVEEYGYLASYDILKHIPSIKKYINFPKIHKYDWAARLNAWIGVGDTKLHCDYAHNLYAQILGQKKIELYSPKSILAKYPVRSTWYSSFNKFDFNPFQPNKEDKDIFYSLKPDFSFVIRPGELLYIPFGWWHRVKALEPSISINQWWLDVSFMNLLLLIMQKRKLGK